MKFNKKIQIGSGFQNFDICTPQPWVAEPFTFFTKKL